MSRLTRLIVFVIFIIAAPLAAHADEGEFPIMADDGSIVANHRMPVALEGRIEKLPGVTVLGNPHGKVTLAEFYDLNCPYCRKASGEIDRLLRSDPQLRLVLVPFPVLGIPSIQAGKVELAVQQSPTPRQFYEFYRKAMASRGVMEGNRALAIAKDLGLDTKKVLAVANKAIARRYHDRACPARRRAENPGDAGICHRRRRHRRLSRCEVARAHRRFGRALRRRGVRKLTGFSQAA